MQYCESVLVAGAHNAGGGPACNVQSYVVQRAPEHRQRTDKLENARSILAPCLVRGEAICDLPAKCFGDEPAQGRVYVGEVRQEWFGVAGPLEICLTQLAPY